VQARPGLRIPEKKAARLGLKKEESLDTLKIRRGGSKERVRDEVRVYYGSYREGAKKCFLHPVMAAGDRKEGAYYFFGG